eukprot:2379245-Rhodomonas_salina.1
MAQHLRRQTAQQTLGQYRTSRSSSIAQYRRQHLMCRRCSTSRGRGLGKRPPYGFLRRCW